jgi:hypothetical protein
VSDKMNPLAQAAIVLCATFLVAGAAASNGIWTGIAAFLFMAPLLALLGLVNSR